MRVVIELRPSPEILSTASGSAAGISATELTGELPGFVLDSGFSPVTLPPAAQAVADTAQPGTGSYLVRGEIPDGDRAAREALAGSAGVTGVFADPVIEPVRTCGDDGAVGDWNTVAELLGRVELTAAGLTGEGVAVAVLDSGINAAKVRAASGAEITIDPARSWNPAGVTGTAGEFAVGHGTMCAFDALIAAPRATFLDIPLLQSSRTGGSEMDGLLSDALAAFAYLRTVLTQQPAERRALVVSNSWGAFSPQWDFPVGDPGNYSDNPGHPFNVIVGSLDAAGADILFAAGNCGRDCPDGRCAYPERPITGANSHPNVLSVAGVDTGGQRVGYSSQGPGRLADRKPDICSYTHFLGSTAFGAEVPDTGTSASCPVLAGVVAAFRTKWPATRIPPARLRELLHRTAADRGGAGFDHDHGYGVAEPRALLAELQKAATRA
ncbi:S8 family serine peptidase [Nocardia flavorosea]|uniref:S8 family peptidase n=1 Tax=Nocardia flavorosea TaxID=53429 RepID=UPI001894DD52|nr:S8 family serine peptidase [Nocardia flavorosea]MBF6351935.1 S8 family serine peptidase [Nocardia flavorosea]